MTVNKVIFDKVSDPFYTKYLEFETKISFNNKSPTWWDVEEVFLTAEAILISVEAFIDIEAEDLTSLLDEAWNAEDDDAAAAAWLK